MQEHQDSKRGGGWGFRALDSQSFCHGAPSLKHFCSDSRTNKMMILALKWIPGL